MFDMFNQIPEPQVIGRWLITSGAQIAVIMLLAITAIVLLSVAGRKITSRIKRMDKAEGSRFDRRVETVRQVLNTTGVAIIMLVALLMILEVLNIDITPLLASIGVASLALGLGAQALVKDVIGGLFILIEGQYQVGDTVELAGRVGTVEELTLRVTHVRDLNGFLHIIPNGEIRVVTNRARDWSRAVVDVSVPFEEDVQAVIAALETIGQQAAEDEVGSLLLEAPQVTGVEGLEGGNVLLRMVVKTIPDKQFGVERYLRQQIQQQFAVQGLRIAFPRQEFLLHSPGSDAPISS
jgi:moderate conductance mechanosensitive channel